MEKRIPQQQPQGTRGLNPMPDFIGDTGTENIVLPASQQRIPVGAANPSIPPEQPNAQEFRKIDEKIATQFTQSAIDREVMQERIMEGVESARALIADPYSKNPKDILAGLISKGYHTKDVEIFNQTWTLKALSQKDILLSFNEITDDNITRVGQTTAMLFGQIVYAVEAVNGISIYEWFSEIDRSKFPSTESFQLAVRRAFLRYLEQMPNSIINKFVEKYNEVEEERNKAVFELKNS